MGAFAIFHFLDRMVVTLVDDGFFLDFGVRDIINQGPSDTTATSRVDKSVLGAGVKGIFTIYEFRV